jgi:hypothetical protein
LPEKFTNGGTTAGNGTFSGCWALRALPNIKTTATQKNFLCAAFMVTFTWGCPTNELNDSSRVWLAPASHSSLHRKRPRRFGLVLHLVVEWRVGSLEGVESHLF